MDHDQTALGPPGKWHSGRGERRPQTARAARTNDPLRLPEGLHGLSPQARRWRDLINAYSAKLGERMKDEHVRVLLGSLVSLTLIAERLNDEVTRGQPVDPNHLIQVSQTIMRLLNELGVSAAPRAESPLNLKAHIAKRVGVAK
jgi:hypothetical protein